MSDIQPGKALERLVEMIQDHLKDCPEVQISRNVRLKSQSGKGREIDIFVQGKFDGQDIGIAFECKDYKRKITVKEVESFWAVLSKLPQVDKGVMVTTSGYTNEAMMEASMHKIGLYLIDDIPLERIISGHTMYDVKIHFDPIWSALEVHTLQNVDKTAIDLESKFRYVCNDQVVDLRLEVFKSLYNNTRLSCELAAKYMEVGKKSLTMGARITPSSKIYITDIHGLKYEVDYFKMFILIDCTLKECSVSSKKIYSSVKEREVVSISEYDSPEGDDNTWVVVESGDDKKSCYIKHNGIYYKPEIEISGQREDGINP